MIQKLPIVLCLAGFAFCAFAQQDQILPPTSPWKGKSLELVAKKNDVWSTVAENSDFAMTPTYDETMAWFQKLCNTSEMMKMVVIGQSANGRKIQMVIASSDKSFDAASLRSSGKPLLLVQAGIHAGEIDGKDAGMMLLRDIAFGKKRDLLKDVNFLFIPILNVDGHERSSPFNRVNQRGPSNMGWRTNARNLNLNRDYMKLDTEEVTAVVKVMNEYNPSFYVDLHVTDGADYQYDITYGYTHYSPSILKWMNTNLKPAMDKGLKSGGHIPGPLIFATNDRDFSMGNSEFAYSPRFSDHYGSLRRIPSILVENHSLKPFKQRVLGTYVFLETLLMTTGKNAASLKSAIAADASLRNPEIVLTWSAADKTDSMELLGIESMIEKSRVTNADYVRWTGKKVTQKIPNHVSNKPGLSVKRPKAYWVPGTYSNVIDRLAKHGVQMERINQPIAMPVDLYRIFEYKFATEPFEGHFGVSTKSQREKHNEIFYPGAVRISTDQPLGDLVVHLLEPSSPDSFFSWGFFPEVFVKTEYIEEYAIEPLARLMLEKDEELTKAFENKKQQDPKFANDPRAIYTWFYNQSPFVDSRYLLYPVGVED